MLMIGADEIQNNVLTAHLLIMYRDIDCSKAFICQLCLVNQYASLKRYLIYLEAIFVSEI